MTTTPHTPEKTPLWFSRAGARAVDHAAANELMIPGILLMEHAAIALRDAALTILRGTDGPVCIVCGTGNNGGDGYALARLLHVAGVPVNIVAAHPTDGLTGDAATNARAARMLGLPIRTNGALDAHATLIVDALLGTGLAGPVRSGIASLINAINDTGSPVLAVDIPSGLDADTGRPLGATVTASTTMTFCGMKNGFADPASRRYTGRVRVAPIGVPASLLERFGTPAAERTDT